MNFGMARLATEKADSRPALPMLFKPVFSGNTLKKLTYAEQLKHPQWQKKRLEMLSYAGFQCQSCDSKEKTLHVHHKRYVKGRSVWEYSRDELVVLCEDCHSDHHKDAETLAALIAAYEGEYGSVKPLIDFLYGHLSSTGANGVVKVSSEENDDSDFPSWYELGILLGIVQSYNIPSVYECAAMLPQLGYTPLQQRAIDHWKKRSNR